MPHTQWPQDEEARAAIRRNWAPEVGDCRQELVFIGQNIDFDRLHRELDACLLDDAELARGVEGWLGLPDPFEPWLEQAS